MKSLHQQVAVITGAASGIGRATALHFAEAGASLALVDIDEPGLARVRIEARRILGDADAVKTYPTNVGDPDAMKALASHVHQDFGAVHILINNAGINVTAPFEAHSLEDFQRVFDVNLNGVIYGCHFFLPLLKAAPQAHIVNVSSVFGIVGVAGQSAYSASKFAVRGFSEALHEELVDTGIHLSLVHPGCINTNIVKTATIVDDGSGRSPADLIEYFEKNGAPPEAVARRILQAILKKEHRVLVTPESYLLDFLRRLAPTSGNRLANRLMLRLMEIRK